MELQGVGALGGHRRQISTVPPSAEDGMRHLLLTVDVERLYRHAPATTCYIHARSYCSQAGVAHGAMILSIAITDARAYNRQIQAAAYLSLRAMRQHMLIHAATLAHTNPNRNPNPTLSVEAQMVRTVLPVQRGAGDARAGAGVHGGRPQPPRPRQVALLGVRFRFRVRVPRLRCLQRGGRACL